jgi:hypothetical protein
MGYLRGTNALPKLCILFEVPPSHASSASNSLEGYCARHLRQLLQSLRYQSYRMVSSQRFCSLSRYPFSLLILSLVGLNLCFFT